MSPTIPEVLPRSFSNFCPLDDALVEHLARGSANLIKIVRPTFGLKSFYDICWRAMFLEEPFFFQNLDSSRTRLTSRWLLNRFADTLFGCLYRIGWYFISGITCRVSDWISADRASWTTSESYFLDQRE